MESGTESPETNRQKLTQDENKSIEVPSDVIESERVSVQGPEEFAPEGRVATRTTPALNTTPGLQTHSEINQSNFDTEKSVD